MARVNACGIAAHGQVFFAGGEFSDNVKCKMYTCEVQKVETNKCQTELMK